jgi:bacillithiol biosynthesis cysteine-adding enzyme BshC
MLKKMLSYQDTGAFSKTVLDYLDKAASIAPFMGDYPDLKGFEKQIALKKVNIINSKQRAILADVITKQYQDFTISTQTKANIALLREENTFTITTGHQLNLFSGPLYFLYKIISAINLSKQLKEAFPAYNFVPIYWMASEDQDFEEIQYFNYKSHKITWAKGAKGAVGRLDNQGLTNSYATFKNILSNTDFDKELLALFEASYLKHNSLSQATINLANALFKDYGLVILDADNALLKKYFIPTTKDELINKTCFNTVSKTNTTLAQNYKIQVNPREINLFYLMDNLRERIIYKNENYYINNTTIVFNQAEILSELENHPERFSPNVLMRPLYQEVILPNLCYIGGGGELAYWLELKTYFEANNVVFPIYLLRNSALIISKKQEKQLDKLNISIKELFLNENNLIKKKISEKSSNPIDFEALKVQLAVQFDALEKAIKLTDASFYGAVSAEKSRQLKSLEKLEKRFYKAEKKRLIDFVSKIEKIKSELFPNNSLQERNQNFGIIYSQKGKEFINLLAENLDPLDLRFTVLTI